MITAKELGLNHSKLIDAAKDGCFKLTVVYSTYYGENEPLVSWYSSVDACLYALSAMSQCWFCRGTVELISNGKCLASYKVKELTYDEYKTIGKPRYIDGTSAMFALI